MSKITISNIHPEQLEYQEMQELSDTEQKALLGGEAEGPVIIIIIVG
ncbi:MAG: hypothetical protein PUP93_03880 [Rhizonema sp. NSF051]|nr:hypothetical protein [Rhizonema sp. NSF051]